MGIIGKEAVLNAIDGLSAHEKVIEGEFNGTKYRMTAFRHPMAFSPGIKAPVDVLQWQALALWADADKPDDSLFHLNTFIRIESL